MNFDLRLPIGILFSFYGLLLSGYGLMTSGNEMYKRSLDINMNLGWGLVLLVFGVFMLVLALRSRGKPEA
jgi:Na+/H+ antiporter NhaD/arsenite permease-like protein